MNRTKLMMGTWSILFLTATAMAQPIGNVNHGVDKVRSEKLVSTE